MEGRLEEKSWSFRGIKTGFLECCLSSTDSSWSKALDAEFSLLDIGSDGRRLEKREMDVNGHRNPEDRTHWGNEQEDTICAVEEAQLHIVDSCTNRSIARKGITKSFRSLTPCGCSASERYQSFQKPESFLHRQTLVLASQGCSHCNSSACTKDSWLLMTTGSMPRQLPCVNPLTWSQVAETTTIPLIGMTTLFPRAPGFCCGQTSHRTIQMEGWYF